MSVFHLTIIGGGILGLATAMAAAERFPGIKLLVLEKEDKLGSHQTGHNSGVIHSGIYYKPGSIKAQTCVSGRKALLDFCEQQNIPYKVCGKVIIATREGEISWLEELCRRGRENGVQGLEIIGSDRLREIEPHATGIKALHVPSTGIVDFTKVAHAYARIVQRRGGEILTSHEVRGITVGGAELILTTPSREFRTKYLINCAGLQADRLARVKGSNSPKSHEDVRIVPFRGEYYSITPERRFLVRALIYPVPDPRFPFLGVHFTRTIHGEVEAGPNAVLAFAREGYRKGDVNFEDLWDVLSYKGFRSMARKYWKTGIGEFYRSARKQAFVKALQRFVPEIGAEDLIPGGAGVRAQAVSPDGNLVDDFVIRRSNNVIHVLNAPSPGATASLAIGKQIVDAAEESFALRN